MSKLELHLTVGLNAPFTKLLHHIGHPPARLGNVLVESLVRPIFNATTNTLAPSKVGHKRYSVGYGRRRIQRLGSICAAFDHFEHSGMIKVARARLHGGVSRVHNSSLQNPRLGNLAQKWLDKLGKSALLADQAFGVKPALVVHKLAYSISAIYMRAERVGVPVEMRQRSSGKVKTS